MRKNRSHLMVLLILAVLLASSLIGSAVGKYIKTMSFPGTVTFSATLAESMVLQEHLYRREPDGDYETTPTILPTEADSGNINGNEYVLLPGHDIHKDPYIKITGKTSIPAYLFVKVVDGTADTLTFAMEDCWLQLSETGGTAVYVYAAKNAEGKLIPKAIDNNSPTVYQILKDNKVTVSQDLEHGEAAGNLDFYAYMGETAFSTEADPITQAKAVYTAIS